MSLLAVEGLVRRFGPTAAVDGVDLQVDAGEVVGLLGANGAGKTTLIRMALGLPRPDAGRVRLFGEAPSRRTRSRLGYVPQGLGLYDDLTVAENLRFAAAVFGAGGAATDRELEAVADRTVRTLPLGLRRRVAYLAATQHDPRLLVLDEPTSGVDPLARSRLWERIRAAAEGGVGVLVTTHHLAEAEQCDRLVLLARGHVVAAGTITELVGDRQVVMIEADRWQDAYAALREAGREPALVARSLRVLGLPLPEAQAILDRAGASGSLRMVPATLEERFVELAA